MTEAVSSSKPYKWVVAILVTANIFMAMLDSTIVDIVLPQMMSTFEVDLYDIQWVVISYFLGSVIGMSCVGWLGDCYGTKILFLVGVVLFTICSVICGVSGNLDVMNVARFVQGVAEGLILPTGLVILFSAFPKSEHGLAMGFYGLGAAFAPAIGPSLGGLITEHFSWRWIFYVNIPIGIFSFFGGWLSLDRGHYGHEPRRFDHIGFVLMCISFSSLIMLTTKGQEYGWLESDFILALLAIFIVSFPLLIVWSVLSRHPLLDMRLFRNRTFSSCTITFCFLTFGMYGIYILFPVYLEKIRQFSTLTSGLILLPGSLVGAFAILITGYLVDRWKPKRLLIMTLTGCFAACFFFTTDLWVSKQDIALQYGVWLLFLAASFIPLYSMSLSMLPTKDLNMGSTILNVFRLLFGSVGTAYATTLLGQRHADYFTILTSKAHYGAVAVRSQITRLLETSGGVIDPAQFAMVRRALRDYINANSIAFSFEAVFQNIGMWFGLAIIAAAFIRLPKVLKKDHHAEI